MGNANNACLACIQPTNKKGKKTVLGGIPSKSDMEEIKYFTNIQIPHSEQFHKIGKFKKYCIQITNSIHKHCQNTGSNSNSTHTASHNCDNFEYLLLLFPVSTTNNQSEVLQHKKKDSALVSGMPGQFTGINNIDEESAFEEDNDEEGQNHQQQQWNHLAPRLSKEEIQEQMKEVICLKSIRKVYDFQRILGQGSFGSIRHQIAALIIPKKYEKSSKSNTSKGYQTMREIYLHMQMDHPNIVKLYDIYEDEDEYHSVLEYCEGGSLGKRDDPVPEKQAAVILRQVLRALNYMHSTLHIAHRDVKAENILFKSSETTDLTIKLCDFGFSTPSYQDQPHGLKSIVGSPYYIAPEVLNQKYDYRCDMWSVGILLFFMLSHTFPFKGQTSEDIFHSIKKDKLTFDGAIWDKVSDQAKDLISKLLVKSPDIRLNALEALNHPYLIKSLTSNSSTRVRDYSEKVYIPLEASQDPLKKVTTVHCARIQQQSSQNSTARLEIAQRFESLDSKHLGLVSVQRMKYQIGIVPSQSNSSSDNSANDQEVPYFEFLNLAYSNQPLKREHLWMAFRFLSDCGDDQQSLITVQSFRRRLLMMDWHRYCTLKLNNQLIDEYEPSRIQTLIEAVIAEIQQGQSTPKQCIAPPAKEQGISFCQFMSYMQANCHK